VKERSGVCELRKAFTLLQGFLAPGVDYLLSSEIVGREVIDSQGERLGSIHDIQFDEKGWNVLAIGVQLQKEVADRYNLGHRFRKTEVMIDVKHVQAVGDKVILSGPSKELLQLVTSSAK
jgi:sporulation protein YlmC with PRC-barrel domain